MSATPRPRKAKKSSTRRSSEQRRDNTLAPVKPALWKELHDKLEADYQWEGELNIAKIELAWHDLYEAKKIRHKEPPNPQTLRNFRNEEPKRREYWFVDGLCQLLLGCSLEEWEEQHKQVQDAPQEKVQPHDELSKQVQIAEIEKLNSQSQSLLLSHDQLGALLAAANWKWIFLWSLDSSEPQIYEHSYVVKSISFSPDGKMLASANSDGTIKLWNLDGDELHELQTFRGHRAEINKVNFSSDGRVLASAGQDGTVRLWSLESRKLPTLRGHSKGISKISFSPDGKMLASASYDGTVKLWSLDGTELHTFSEHKDSMCKYSTGVRRVSFSPDSQTLVSCCDSGNVKIWSLNGTVTNTFKVEVIYPYDMSISPNFKRLVITDETDFKNITIWSINGTLIKTLEEKKLGSELKPPIFTSFSPDGEIIACVDYYGEVKLYSYDGIKLHRFEACNNPINCVSFSPDGNMLALASEDGTLHLWSLDGNELKIFHGHSGEVKSVTFSPNGQILASAGLDETVKLWSLDGTELHTFRGHTDTVNSVAFSPDGQVLASASEDGTMILWNLNVDNLLIHSCNWLRDYLKTNPNVSESDRHLCDGIGTQK